jgi:hypothetical protein
MTTKEIQYECYIPVDYLTTDQRFVLNGRDTARINIVQNDDLPLTEDSELNMFFEYPTEEWK